MHLPLIANELLLFAAFFYALLGLDDVLVDIGWFLKARCRDSLFTAKPLSKNAGKVAVFVAAWQESDVIGAMVSNARKQWGDGAYRIFVGCYPNDLDTQSAIEPFEDDWVKKVVGPHDGPTSKADCLNAIWNAFLNSDDYNDFATVLLHDAEDLVHPKEIILFQSYAQDYDFLQIPVIPLPDKKSPWVAGHYLDEFAEAHQKELPFRQCLGASLPSAGTGCAISLSALAAIAKTKQGKPFDALSLTEDYELGLGLWQAGFSSRFLRMRDPDDGSLIAIRSHFPDDLFSSIRQKTRWIMGIALAGWDRVGWQGGMAEHWMRWRDRRIFLSAIVMIAGYSGAILAIIAGAMGDALSPNPFLVQLLTLNLMLLMWRWMVRASFTSQQYGVREGLKSIPRALMGNLIAMAASLSAASSYLRYLLTGHVRWNKTQHRFPHEIEKPTQ